MNNYSIKQDGKWYKLYRDDVMIYKSKNKIKVEFKLKLIKKGGQL